MPQNESRHSAFPDDRISPQEAIERFTRELSDAKPGEAVSIEVFGNWGDRVADAVVEHFRSRGLEVFRERIDKRVFYSGLRRDRRGTYLSVRNKP